MEHSWFLLPALALAAGLLALAPLGEQVLARGVVFIDLAVAQAAAAAALWVTAGQEHPDLPTTQAAAAAGALACVGLVAALARRWPQQREALIGLVYVACACGALMAARQGVHGGERLSQLLAADILWAGGPQVLTLLACLLGVHLLRRAAPRLWGSDAGFYPAFALVASVAVPVLGLFVLFAALIAPALWQRRGLPGWAAQAGTAMAAAAGLGASWWLDAPSGVCVALAMALWGVASAWVPVKRPVLVPEGGSIDSPDHL